MKRCEQYEFDVHDAISMLQLYTRELLLQGQTGLLDVCNISAYLLPIGITINRAKSQTSGTVGVMGGGGGVLKKHLNINDNSRVQELCGSRGGRVLGFPS